MQDKKRCFGNSLAGVLVRRLDSWSIGLWFESLCCPPFLKNISICFFKVVRKNIKKWIGILIAAVWGFQYHPAPGAWYRARISQVPLPCQCSLTCITDFPWKKCVFYHLVLLTENHLQKYVWKRKITCHLFSAKLRRFKQCFYSMCKQSSYLK